MCLQMHFGNPVPFSEIHLGLRNKANVHEHEEDRAGTATGWNFFKEAKSLVHFAGRIR